MVIWRNRYLTKWLFDKIVIWRIGSLTNWFFDEADCYTIWNNFFTASKNGTNVNFMTVSRNLRSDFGLESFLPVRKPRLTEAMKSKRLAKWNLDNWKLQAHLCFQMNLLCKSSLCEIDSLEEPKTMKHLPRQMIWGGTSKSGTCKVCGSTAGETKAPYAHWSVYYTKAGCCSMHRALVGENLWNRINVKHSPCRGTAHILTQLKIYRK